VNIQDIVAYARTDILDDTISDNYLWNDKQLTRYAKDAVVEACKRAPILKATFSIPIVANTASYTMDRTVKQIYLATLTNVIGQTTDEELSLLAGASWRTRTGTPTSYVRRDFTLTLYPKPVASDTLVLSTSIVPIDDFDLYDIDEKFLSGLVYYVAYKAYGLRDADTFDKQASASNMELFNQFFGLPKSAKWHTIAQETPMYATVIGGRIA